MIVVRNTYVPPRELGQRIAPNTTPPATRAPLLKRGGDRKEKGGPLFGSASEDKLRAFFLFCGFSLIFSGGACGWLRAARRGTRARLRRWRLASCPWRGPPPPLRPSRPPSPCPLRGPGRGSRAGAARS